MVCAICGPLCKCHKIIQQLLIHITLNSKSLRGRFHTSQEEWWNETRNTDTPHCHGLLGLILNDGTQVCVTVFCPWSKAIHNVVNIISSGSHRPVSRVKAWRSIVALDVGEFIPWVRRLNLLNNQSIYVNSLCPLREKPSPAYSVSWMNNQQLNLKHNI